MLPAVRVDLPVLTSRMLYARSCARVRHVRVGTYLTVYHLAFIFTLARDRIFLSYHSCVVGIIFSRQFFEKTSKGKTTKTVTASQLGRAILKKISSTVTDALALPSSLGSDAMFGGVPLSVTIVNHTYTCVSVHLLHVQPRCNHAVLHAMPPQ